MIEASICKHSTV